MDSIGRMFTGANVSFTIVRSGRRNDLGLTAGSATVMVNPIQNISGTWKLVVNNSDSVVAASATAYKEKWQVDADEIPTTIFTTVICTPVETASCGGTLPGHVNPYVKGLVGNFKPYRSYVYYGTRMETNPAVDTRIRHNGYIQGFGNYWNFNTNSNLVPDNTNTNWLWNTEVTKINSKGQELETHDALNRYTAAQYGFAKNFPVAVVQNARDGQSFDEGFEDYHYNESLNNAMLDTCGGTKYLSFAGLTNSNIVNTDSGNLRAHSGQYFLRVNGNSKASLPLSVAASPIDTFNFDLKNDTTLVLVDTGGNVTNFSITPKQTGNPLIGFQNGFGGSVAQVVHDTIIGPEDGEELIEHSFFLQTTQFMDISTSGNYTIHFDVTNTGTRAGFEVPQIYVGDRHASVPRPIKELKGFAKVELDPGQSKHVQMTLDRRAFSYYDVKTHAWTVAPGDFDIYVAHSSADIELTGKTSVQ